jgi:hypothetical protein
MADPVDSVMALTVDDLRQKRVDGTPVLWPGQHAYGIVMRVARDGSWADMRWWQGPPSLGAPPSGFPTWTKRQPLARLSEWRHG